MRDDLSDDHQGESWADILARRSPEGRAIVDQLRSAEEAALCAQRLITDAMSEGRECAREFKAFEDALAEVDRMRREVYRMARQ